MTGKPSGMEMMIRSIMKAFGVDPETLRAEIEGRLKQFEESVQSMDQNLRNISTRLDKIDLHIEQNSFRLDKLDWHMEQIELHLGLIAGEVPLDLRDPTLQPQPMKLKGPENDETESENHGRRGSRNRH